MAITDPQDTLAYHLSRPFTSLRDVSHVPVASVTKKLGVYMDGNTVQPSPESEALWFYALNQGLAYVRRDKELYEPLGEFHGFVERYYDILSPKAVRAFYYLLLICSREARHLKHTEGLEKQIIKKFGSTAWKWTSATMGESDVKSKLVNSPPDLSLGYYVGALRHVFYHGKWSSGYGGPAWGEVTDCLCRFVHGETSPELMMDTVWTLAHNNGPIFNKGMLYQAYSSTIYKILDVQASGQILEMILSKGLPVKYDESDLVVTAEFLKSKFSADVGNHVDWFAVEALGSKQSYPVEKKQQAASGYSTPASAAAIAAANKAKEKQAELQKKEQEQKAAEAKLWFEVMPGLKLKKIIRKQAA